MKSQYDVLIVGGGPAGLSAAMALGRLGRTALVCDDGRPRNAPAAHLNNFPGRDGIAPSQWRREVRQDLTKYQTIEFHDGRVETLVKNPQGFKATLHSGETLNFRLVILAEGVLDPFPPYPGYAELWGKAIFHCPYCHGFEVAGRKLGVLANGPMAAHALPMIYALSSDLVLFTNGPVNLPDDLLAASQRRGVSIIQEEIVGFEHHEEKMSAVRLRGGKQVEREALFTTPQFPMQPKSQLGVRLGCQRTEMGFYQVTDRNESSVAGVFVAGDSISPMHSVLLAAASGAVAGAGAVFALVNEQFRI